MGDGTLMELKYQVLEGRGFKMYRDECDCQVLDLHGQRDIVKVCKEHEPLDYSKETLKAHVQWRADFWRLLKERVSVTPISKAKKRRASTKFVRLPGDDHRVAETLTLAVNRLFKRQRHFYPAHRALSARLAAVIALRHLRSAVVWLIRIDPLKLHCFIYRAGNAKAPRCRCTMAHLGKVRPNLSDSAQTAAPLACYLQS